MKLSRAWLWVLLLVPMGIGLARLRFDVEILNLLPKKISSAEGRPLKIYQKYFSDARELILTVEAPTPRSKLNPTGPFACPGLARRNESCLRCDLATALA